MRDHDALAEIIRKEAQLLDPETCCQPDFLRELIHSEYLQITEDGHVHDAESVIEALASQQDPPEIEATDFEAVLIVPDVILVTFKTKSNGQTCLQSSIWIQDIDDQWIRRFNQATHIH